MAEQLCELKKKGGGGGSTSITVYSDTANKTITSNYLFLVRGLFLSCSLRRPMVNVAPKIAFYVKQGNTYTQVSESKDPTYNGATFNATSSIYGDIYVRKSEGSDFTTNLFNLTYAEPS